jgi:hypothetical protein
VKTHRFQTHRLHFSTLVRFDGSLGG